MCTHTHEVSKMLRFKRIKEPFVSSFEKQYEDMLACSWHAYKGSKASLSTNDLKNKKQPQPK